jgi:hypothetical protein
MKSKFNSFALATMMALASLTIDTSNAATIIGGNTTVTLDPGTVSTITGAGVALNTFGIATIDPTTLVVTFPITGGETDPLQIEHAGSGLIFSRNGISLTISDFLIDFTIPSSPLISGSVNTSTSPIGAAGVTLFNIVGPNLTLTLSSAAGAALAATLEIPDLAGATIGTAATDPTAVPEPQAYLLMSAGLGTMFCLVRKRKS